MFIKHGVVPAFLILLGGSMLPHAAFAVAALQDAASDVSDSDGGGSGGGSSASTGSSSAGSTTNGSSSGAITIPCLDDSGKATGGSTGSCSAILPKCTDLKNSYEKNVKKFLAFKIYGYYQGKNIDLNASNMEGATPVLAGEDLLYPICSVVGHHMKYEGANAFKSFYSPCTRDRAAQRDGYQSVGIEYSKQTIGRKISCGLRPSTDNGSTDISLGFQGDWGSLWNSWLVGAYPWLIRRHAYDVLHALKPDLSNLNDVVSSTSVKKDLQTVNGKMNTFYSTLSSDAKEVCNKSASEVVDKCNKGTMSLTDPAHRLCTLVKAQSSVNSGALPNMLVMEIMARVQADYDRLFANLLRFNSFPSDKLTNKCKDTGALFRSARGKKSRSISCLMDGGEFFTLASKNTVENDKCESSSRAGELPVLVRIRDGAIEGKDNTYTTRARYANPDHTMMMGFGGLVESVIRRDVCKQQRYTDASICDEVAIPDDPKDVK